MQAKYICQSVCHNCITNFSQMPHTLDRCAKTTNQRTIKINYMDNT